MTEKRYYKKNWEELYYVFDSNTISEDEFEERVEYEDYYVFGDSLTGSEIIGLLNENDELKKENQRMTGKLNQLALEFLNYDMVSMGKATEISEMGYYDFLKYRKENGNPMELQL